MLAGFCRKLKAHFCKHLHQPHTSKVLQFHQQYPIQSFFPALHKGATEEFDARRIQGSLERALLSFFGSRRLVTLSD